MKNSKDYRSSVYLGTVNGKKIIKTVRAHSQKELDKIIASLKYEAAAGKDVYNKATFGDWASKWYKEVKEHSGICRGTLIQYQSAIKLLNEAFEFIELKKIKLSDFQRFINELAAQNPNTKQPTSRRTLESVKKVAGAIFEYAYANNVSGAPRFVKSVVIPKNAPLEKRRALSIEEIQYIIDTPHRAQLPAMIMLFSGLRRGEVLALEWPDIDFENSLINVSKSVFFESNQGKIKHCGKTVNATRTVPIPPILVSYLRDYKSNCKTISKYICTNTNGKLHSKTSWVKMWNSYLIDLNLKYGYPNAHISKFDPTIEKGSLPFRIKRFTPHYLRHTFATLLYLQGVDMVTAKQILGHADIQTTVNIYTDLKNFHRATLPADFMKKLQNEYNINRKVESPSAEVSAYKA